MSTWQPKQIVQALRAPQQQIGVREEPTLKIEGLGQSPMMSAAGAQQAGNDFGQLLNKGGNMAWDMFKGSDTGKDMMSGAADLFGGFSNGTVKGGSGIRGGAPMAGGGTGGGFGNAMSSIFGGSGGAGGSSGGSPYAMLDGMFGDKVYGKQKTDDNGEVANAAKSALTTAAYSNPISAAALWADRLLLKGKGMDTLTGWLG